MEEIRFVKKEKLTVYSNSTGEFLYNIEKRGVIRKSIYLMSEEDKPLALIKSNLFRTTWKAEDLNQDGIIKLKRSFFRKKIRVIDKNYTYSLWMNIKNKIQMLEDNSSKIAFTIDLSRLKSKDSLVIESSDYLHHHIVSLILTIVIMDKKLI